jgi:hypothetical protein
MASGQPLYRGHLDGLASNAGGPELMVWGKLIGLALIVLPIVFVYVAAEIVVVWGLGVGEHNALLICAPISVFGGMAITVLIDECIFRPIRAKRAAQKLKDQHPNG